MGRRWVFEIFAFQTIYYIPMADVQHFSVHINSPLRIAQLDIDENRSKYRKTLFAEIRKTTFLILDSLLTSK